MFSNILEMALIEPESAKYDIVWYVKEERQVEYMKARRVAKREFL